MAVRRIKEAAPKLSLRNGISMAAVLIASVFGVPLASATPPTEAAGAVGSVLPPVPETSAPSLPSAAPPQAPVPAAPQAPVEVPAVPQAPVKTSPAPQTPAPRIPSVEASETTPNPRRPALVPSRGSTGPSGPGVDRPSAGTATSDSTGGAQQTIASARNRAGKGRDSHGATRPGVEAGSVESAKVASLRRLFAYVWPALALGPGWRLLATLQTGWKAATPLAMFDVPPLLSGLTAGVTGAGGVAGISEHSVTPSPSPSDSTGAWVPDGSEIPLFVFIISCISCAVLIALLAFTVSRELRSMHRWPF